MTLILSVSTQNQSRFWELHSGAKLPTHPRHHGDRVGGRARGFGGLGFCDRGRGGFIWAKRLEKQ